MLKFWKSRLFNPRSVTGVLCLTALAALCLVGCQPAPKKDPATSVTELRQQIEALQFVNSLQLDSKQLPGLAKVLQQASVDRQKSEDEKGKLLSQLVPLLQRRRQELLSDTADAAPKHEAAPTSDRGGAAKTNSPGAVSLDDEIRGLEAKMSDLEWPTAEAVKRIAAQLRGVLNEQQIALAAGELDARIQATQMLEGYRQLPQEEFSSEIRPFAEELVSRGSSMTAEQVQALFTEARSLTEPEYKANKDKLVRQLEPLFAPAGEAQDQLLVDVFAHPQVLQVLEMKAKGTPSK
ncbi:hypothetical protein LLH03_16320 [bacterium]|nr:hypothetical protein [bacterium]